jgi:hypothetical protein
LWRFRLRLKDEREAALTAPNLNRSAVPGLGIFYLGKERNMSERKEVKSVKVTVESQSHVSGAAPTKTAKGEGCNLDEALAQAEKKQKD